MNRRHVRLINGSSLIEVMMSATLLAIGMSAILMLMLRGFEENRDASWTVNAATMASAALEQITTGPVTSVDAMAGTTTVQDPVSKRNFTQVVTVTSLTDAGVRARRVDVTISWASHIGGNGFRGQTVSSIVSEFISDNPDAGP